MNYYKSPFTSYQEKFIRDKCTSMYINEIAEELGSSYFPVRTFILQNNLKQKKVMKPQVKERRVQYVKKGKVREVYFNIHEKWNWAI